MKKEIENKRVVITISVAVLLISAIVVPLVVLIENEDQPIIIESDEDFLKYDFPGTGTAEDPYIIENYEIRTEEWLAIAISNVSKSFIIRNNQLQSSRYGIWLAVSSPDIAIIANNTFNMGYNAVGMTIYDVSGCQIINNTFKNAPYGIAAWKLGPDDSWMECSIINNTFINIIDNPILIVKLNKAFVEGNICIFTEEYVEQNEWRRGFEIVWTGNLTLRNNILSNMGISLLNYELDTYFSHTIENNLVNGKEFGYFTNLENETYNSTDYGQLYFINCSLIHVENSFLENCSIGVNFAFSSNCSAYGNTFSHNRYAGVSIINSIGIDIHSNIFDGNYYGLYVVDSLDIDINNNTFKNGRYGCSISNSTYTLGINIFQNNEQDIDI